jgi:hypothetical protein
VPKDIESRLSELEHRLEGIQISVWLLIGVILMAGGGFVFFYQAAQHRVTKVEGAVYQLGSGVDRLARTLGEPRGRHYPPRDIIDSLRSLEK